MKPMKYGIEHKGFKTTTKTRKKKKVCVIANAAKKSKRYPNR